MKPVELTVLLPCHSLEDFPTYYEGEEAEGLLAAWTALWHPALIAAAQKMPTWHRADTQLDSFDGRVVVIPPVCEKELQAGYPERAKTEGALVVRKLFRREAIVAALLEGVGGDPRQANPGTPPLAPDFLALGFAYLQTELLTRRMRYMSNIDEVHFSGRVVAAATAWAAGDDASAREALQDCFDVLAQAKDHFYAVDTYLIDLTLVAGTTLGSSLRTALGALTPVNVLVSGRDVEQMAAREPQSLAALRDAIAGDRATLVGGEYDPADLSLWDPESVLAELNRGLDAYRTHLGYRPVVFGRRPFGLSPALPQILSRLGFIAALHVAFDEGRLPTADQSKTRWQGIDDSAIDALTRPPLDAARPESFLGFSLKLGESMDRDHVACVAFAHWPGQTCDYFEDLRRTTSYVPVFGKFVTLDSFFRDTASPGQITKFDADQYVSAYLRQAIVRKQADPLSAHVRRDAARATGLAVSSLDTLESVISGRTDPVNGESDPAKMLDFLAERIAQRLPRSSGEPRDSFLALNPCSFSRSATLDVSRLAAPPNVVDPVVASGESSHGRQAVVNVPAQGFAWITAGEPPQKVRWAKKSPPMAEPGLLRNDFVEIKINAQSGAIQAIIDHAARVNLLSQHLGMRLPGDAPKPGEPWRDPDDEPEYSGMVCDSMEVESAGPVVGRIVTRGRLIDRDKRPLARFEQAVEVVRGSRVVGLEITLDVAEEPRADPWNSYYACRFAWPDETADLARAVCGCRQKTERERIESPQLVEIEMTNHRVAILPGGLPFHRRVGLRMLDTLLVVRGESERKFRIGIGVDLVQPIAAAVELHMPTIARHEFAAPPAVGPASWFCHFDARNIVATHWQALVEEGKVTGFRVRLLETLGRRGTVNLSTFRPVRAARQTDFESQPLVTLSIVDERVAIDVGAFEWVQVEAWFK